MYVLKSLSLDGLRGRLKDGVPWFFPPLKHDYQLLWLYQEEDFLPPKNLYRKKKITPRFEVKRWTFILCVLELWTLWSIHSLYSEWMNDFIWRAELSCEAWPILKVSNHQTGTDTTHIFWTYGTDKTCSFWTEMTIYGHEVTDILFLIKPVHSGLKWPYMDMGHTFCFW